MAMTLSGSNVVVSRTAPVAGRREAHDDPGKEGPRVVAQQRHAEAADRGEHQPGDEQGQGTHVARDRTQGGDDRIHRRSDEHHDRRGDVDADPREDRAGQQEEQGRDPGDDGDDKPPSRWRNRAAAPRASRSAARPRAVVREF